MGTTGPGIRPAGTARPYPRPAGTARSLIRVSASGLAFADAMIQAGVLNAQYRGALYMGILVSFALVFLSMLGLALLNPPFSSVQQALGRLTRFLGVLLMAGLIGGYVATRTLGLPGFHAPWSAVGITTVVMEGIILGLLITDTVSADNGMGRRRPAGSTGGQDTPQR